MAKPKVLMAVLAAGSSRRFGDEDKLAARFRGKPLGAHICDNAPVDRIAPDCAFVITSREDHPCRPAWEKAGFRIALNARADQGMGTSVALAALLAQKEGCSALLVALADMPLVPLVHLNALIDAVRTPEASVCSSDGHARMPPAIFGKKHFATLAGLAHDVGARSLLRDARKLSCAPEWLIDIDTPEAMARYA